MKLISSSSAALALLTVASSSGFAPSPALPSQQSRVAAPRQSTELYISSWGARGPPSSSGKKKAKAKDINPEKIQSYIQVPEPATLRSDLGDTVLVSGWVGRDNLGADSDQGIFDLLNDEENGAFDFTSIVAFVDDAKFAKKRLVSRSARYSGLLNKLTFSQATEAGALPEPQQLEGVTSWVARVSSNDHPAPLELIKKIVYRVRSSGVQNVALLVAGASSADMDAALDIVKSLEADVGKSFSVVAVGSESDETEATYPYEVVDMAEGSASAATGGSSVLPSADGTYSREESFRLLTECLGLECGSNRALSFGEVTDVNATSTKLVKGLREAGYSWSQELEHMIEGGLATYEKACEDYKARTPSASEEMGLVTADEKLELAIERAMVEQEREKEEALARMEEKYETSLSTPEWS